VEPEFEKVRQAPEIQRLLAEPHACVVTSLPDEAKGERLVAFYTDPDVTAQHVWELLSATPMPKLWLPKRDDLRFIDAIPTLGTGKVDLRAVRQLASPSDGAQQQALPGRREQRLQRDVEREAATGEGEQTPAERPVDTSRRRA
jgi:acyl-CoA synthetase (AMP-forming)/AMP-acid ligase II